MSLIEINWHPEKKELRKFGIIALIALALISLLLFLIQGISIHWILILNCVGMTIFLSSIVSIQLTRIIYIGLTAVTLPIGWIVSFILLALFYYLLITPLAFVFRLAGRDPLSRKFEPDKESYWLRRNPPDKIDRYFHQF